MRIIREHRCEDDFSWDRVRRSTVFPKIGHITGTVCRERMREKIVKMSHPVRQKRHQIQKESCLRIKRTKSENLFLILPRWLQHSR